MKFSPPDFGRWLARRAAVLGCTASLLGLGAGAGAVKVQMAFTGDFAGAMAAGTVTLRESATGKPLQGVKVHIKRDSTNREASGYSEFETDDDGVAHWFIARLRRLSGEFYEFSVGIAEFNLKNRAGREWDPELSSESGTVSLSGAGSGAQPVSIIAGPALAGKAVDAQRVPLGTQVHFESHSHDPEDAHSPTAGAGIVASFWTVSDGMGELLRGSGPGIFIRNRMEGTHTITLLTWDREGQPGFATTQFVVIKLRRPAGHRRPQHGRFGGPELHPFKPRQSPRRASGYHRLSFSWCAGGDLPVAAGLLL